VIRTAFTLEYCDGSTAVGKNACATPSAIAAARMP
jgi:hypothetical protein